MQQKQALKILTWSTVALVIPLLGQLFVEGWNWTWHDFVFAWIFFNVLGFTCTFVMNKIPRRGYRITAGVIVVALFAFVWMRLATG